MDFDEDESDGDAEWGDVGFEDQNEPINVEEDNFDEKLDRAYSIYLKIKSYIDFHGLNFLDSDTSVSDIIYLF
jgi:hypothetical protein